MTSDLFPRLLTLSAFDGESSAALRTIHAFLDDEFPGCSLALLLVLDEMRGCCRLAGLIGADGTEHIANTDPLGVEIEWPRFDDVVTGRIVSGIEAHALELAPTERALPIAMALLAPACLLAIPIVNAGRVSHWLAIGSTLAGRFSQVDTERVLLEANLIANLVIRPLATRALRNEGARHRAQIESLADVQRMLLPDSPRIRGLDYAVHWQPAETAAGDYYDLVCLSHLASPPLAPDSTDMWSLILADVSGHGAAAAMEGVQFDAILRTYDGSEAPGGPAGALNYANRHFFSRRQRRHFLTVFAMQFRPEERRIDYVCAGHPPVLVLRDGAVHALGAGEDAGIPLGVLREHRWENSSSALLEGDILAIYTDGLIEARNDSLVPFGRDRLIDLLRGGSLDPAEISARITSALNDHQGSSTGVDDQTLIVLRIR
ncbi:MAG: SpoIIE family protein phosphatase [Tahibacter sp.]